MGNFKDDQIVQLVYSESCICLQRKAENFGTVINKLKEMVYSTSFAFIEYMCQINFLFAYTAEESVLKLK